MNVAFVVAATLTGVLVGAVFASLRIPIPAPPSLAGVMGIVGIWAGYRLVRHLGVGFDLLDGLGV
ncbi:XapX domain-containing protein [Halobacterium yunchengense]|uniref:XapX domain-containing protein n=1 Tax=Halobacterium yunchengense TaxID=3108497 RepID=UPI00300B3437